MISTQRKKELKEIGKYINLFGVFFVSIMAGLGLVLFLTIVLLLNFSGNIRTEEMFLLISLLFVSHCYTVFMSMGILSTLMLYTVCQRTGEVLLLEEYSPPSQNLVEKIGLKAEKASFSWVKSENVESDSEQDKLIMNDNDCLKNISFEVTTNEMLIIIGSVGSGKSSLLMGMLGELYLKSGTFFMNGKISYASAEPWLVSESIKQNILMGQEFNSSLYAEVIECCALADDIENMPNKDDTLVGDRGTTLSGGQKSRLSLARALYANADIYLLDDPLSAVDPNVANHIFNKALKGKLKNKAVVLVTHQIQFALKADKVLVLDSGASLFYGSPKELDNMDFIKSHIEESKTRAIEKENKESTITKELNNLVLSNEDINESPVHLSSYNKYLMYGFGSIIVVVLVMIIISISQASFLGLYYYCALWAESENQNSSEHMI